MADDSTNTVFINGAADKVAQGKAFLAKYDVQTPGAEKARPGRPEFQTYSVPSGNADALAQALQEHYRGTTVRIRGCRVASFVVYATPDDQLDIIQTLSNHTKSSKEVTKNLAVGNMDPNDAVSMLGKMFTDPTKGGPVIIGRPGRDPDHRPRQAGAGERRRGRAQGGQRQRGARVRRHVGQDRILTMPKDSSAADLAEALRQMMQSMGPRRRR